MTPRERSFVGQHEHALNGSAPEPTGDAAVDRAARLGVELRALLEKHGYNNAVIMLPGPLNGEGLPVIMAACVRDDDEAGQSWARDLGGFVSMGLSLRHARKVEQAEEQARGSTKQ